MARKAYAEHSFYCINCGNKGIPLMRKQGFKHQGMHRKQLYCVHCKCEVNHVECKTFDEVEEFRENFINGVYKDEAKESIYFVGTASIGQKHMD
jgi:formate dehydrogenase maturation protein FdhE